MTDIKRTFPFSPSKEFVIVRPFTADMKLAEFLVLWTRRESSNTSLEIKVKASDSATPNTAYVDWTSTKPFDAQMSDITSAIGEYIAANSKHPYEFTFTFGHRVMPFVFYSRSDPLEFTLATLTDSKRAMVEIGARLPKNLPGKTPEEKPEFWVELRVNAVDTGIRLSTGYLITTNDPVLQRTVDMAATKSGYKPVLCTLTLGKLV